MIPSQVAWPPGCPIIRQDDRYSMAMVQSAQRSASMDIPNWRESFEREIEMAEAARAAGNQGMARVCARRAAGVVAGEYLRIHGLGLPGPSAYDCLVAASQRPEISSQARQCLQHFLLRVNADHELPVQVDLIEEARWLAGELLG